MYQDRVYTKTKRDTHKCPYCGHVNDFPCHNPCSHLVEVIDSYFRDAVGFNRYYRWKYEGNLRDRIKREKSKCESI